MYKFPLVLPEQSEYVSELETMQIIMCPRNLIDTELLIRLSQTESQAYFQQLLTTSSDLLALGIEQIKSDNPDIYKKGLEIINRLIYRLPYEKGSDLGNAFLARGIFYCTKKKYKLAVADLRWYKFFCLSEKLPDETLLGNLLLCLSLYNMKDFHGAKQVLNSINEMGNLPSVCDSKVLRKYETEINYQSKNLRFKVDTHKRRPLIGAKAANNNKVIRIEHDVKKRNKVVAYDAIREDDLVAVDYTKFNKYNSPFLNCERCGTFQEQLYTCLYCRYITYCSNSCMDEDWELHRNECYGYELGIIPLLEAQFEFRMFIHMAKYFFCVAETLYQEDKVLEDPWQDFLYYASIDTNIDSSLRAILINPFDYRKIKPERWQRIVSTSFRLAVFVYNNTNIIGTYFSRIRLQKEAMICFIGALILRLSGYLTFYCQRVEFLCPINCSSDCKVHDDSKDNAKSINLSDRMNANALSYYRFDPNNDFAIVLRKYKELKLNEGCVPGSKRHRGNPTSEYVNRLINWCLKDEENLNFSDFDNPDRTPQHDIQNAVGKLSSSKRFALIKNMLKYFHQYLDQYFFQPNNTRYVRQDKMSLGLVFETFHNEIIVPNVDISPLSSGVHVGTATANVPTGVELTVPYIPNHHTYNSTILLTPSPNGMFGNNIVRSLINLGGRHYLISLLCDGCPIGKVITPAAPCCSKCGANYYDLLDQNVRFIAHLESEITKFKGQQHILTRRDLKEASQRYLVLLYGTYNDFLTTRFPQGNELLVRGSLKCAEFLANNGFILHASNVLKSCVLICTCDYPLYKTDIFTNIFKVMQIIVDHYIGHINLCSRVPTPSYLTSLLDSAICILQRYEEFLQQFPYDEELFEFFVKQFTNYNKWKQTIFLYNRMPQSVRDFLK